MNPSLIMFVHSTLSVRNAVKVHCNALENKMLKFFNLKILTRWAGQSRAGPRQKQNKPSVKAFVLVRPVSH